MLVSAVMLLSYRGCSVEYRDLEENPFPKSNPISRRQAIKLGGIAVVGLTFSRPMIETILPKPAFANYVTTGQGCTPGYWKNHTDAWPPTGFSPGQSVESVFSGAVAFPSLASSTLLQALSFGGGSGLEGSARILLRAAIAALLSAAHPDVDYPRPLSAVIGSVNSALDSGDRDTMLDFATALDGDNNLGCPLD